MPDKFKPTGSNES